MPKKSTSARQPEYGAATGSALPHVMVLTFDPRLTHSVWCDFSHRCRTLAGLERTLRAETKAGRIVGFRFITIHRDVLGLEPNPTVDHRPTGKGEKQ